jgi:uncharacterized membrane protein
MEIFLLLVLITLVIIFHSTYSSRFKKLHEHINHLQRELVKVLDEKGIREVKKEDAVESTFTSGIITTGMKIVPPVKKEEEKIIEKKEEVPPQVIEKKTEKEPVKTTIPVIENPKVQQVKQPVQPQLSWWAKFTERNPDLEKFIGENLLSKIAITILVLGIAFFVKYAIDRDWINEAARAGIGILCGSIIMAFAHKLRLKFKPFSSVLVAGAIAVFYFTIGIGFHEYHLFSQTVAFVIMFVITAFAVFISVAYDRVELAALAITGGFAVPFMLSTGQGNYKVLFTYILILDLGMLALAYIKKWNLINILAYAFTVILYSAWLGTKVVGVLHGPFKGAFFFGMVFYLVFVLMNVINNIRVKREFSYIELIILISNTFVFYAAGMLILKEWQPEFKGVFTIVMAFFNFALGIVLYKYFKADKKLVYLLVGMTLTFATLAAPVQLKGNYITLFWGAETALLIWLSQRSQLKSFKLASVIVSVLMFFSLIIDLSNVYGYAPNGLTPLTNKGFITGTLCSLFLFTGFFLLKREEGRETSTGVNPEIYGKVLRIAGIFLLYLTGFLEIHQQSKYYLYSDDTVVSVSAFYHIAFTSVLGMFLLRKYTPANNIASFVLLGVNAIYYCFIFSITPYQELQQRCFGQHRDYLGYLVHFPALIAFGAHVVITIHAAVKKQNFLFSARSLFLWIFGVVSIYVLSNEVVMNTLAIKLSSFIRTDEYYIVQNVYAYIHTQVVKVALPVLWGAIAFVFLSAGIKRQVKQLRIIALALLALTLIKLFIYDIKDVSEAGKIIAFIILGIVLLVLSFMYQKIKPIILEEDQTATVSNIIIDEKRID